jgi:hypothetical protein
VLTASLADMALQEILKGGTILDKGVDIGKEIA